MRSRRWSRLLPSRFALAALLATALTARAAHAGGNAAAAQALFEEARVLMASGNYAAGCVKLEGSEALDPGPGTQFNLALCYEKSGRTASAWAMYLESATGYQATNRIEWESKARARAAVLATTLGRITIVVHDAPSDLTVTRDGVAVVASEVGAAIPVDPGAHVIEATARGRTPFHASVDVARGVTKPVEIVLPPAGAAHADAPSSPSAPAAHPSHTLAYVVGGVGLAGLALGTAGGIVALGKNASSTDICPSDGVCRDAAARRDNQTASTWATLSTVGFIAGGTLLAAGIVLFVVAPQPATSAAARLSVAASLGPGTASVVGRW